MSIKQIDPSEAAGYWLTVKDIADIGQGLMPVADTQNWGSRGLIDWHAERIKKNDRRLYSVYGAFQIFVIHQFTKTDGGVLLGQSVAWHARNRLLSAISGHIDLADPNNTCVMMYDGRLADKNSKISVAFVRDAMTIGDVTRTISGLRPGDIRIFAVDEAIKWFSDHYLEWRSNRIRNGPPLPDFAAAGKMNENQKTMEKLNKALTQILDASAPLGEALKRAQERWGSGGPVDYFREKYRPAILNEFGDKTPAELMELEAEGKLDHLLKTEPTE